MRRKLLFAQFLVLSMFSFCIAQAQNIDATGQVKDEAGNAVQGAVVAVKGAKKATTTNDNGSFTINVAKGTTLVISHVGFGSREIVADGSALSITLANQSKELNEVVVTALGIKKEKKALSYAVTEVKGSDLTEARSVNIANSLEGKVAGLNIASTATGAGGSSRIIIRGNGSLSGNNQPLIVVDGIPMNNDNINQQVNAMAGGASSVGMWGGTDQGDGISSLNPDEIESISVLKGGTAAALYGSRASNGAILVTTKSGSKNKNDAIGLEINSNLVAESLLYKKFDDYQYVYGIGDVDPLQDPLHGLKPVPPNTGANFQTNSWGAKLDGSPAVQFDGVSRPYSAVTDNLSKFYKVGTTFTNSVAMSGANDKLTYRFSLSDLNNKGILPNSTLRRDNAALNLGGTMSKRLSFVANIKYISEKTHNRPRLSDSPGNASYTMWTLPTSLSVETLKKNVLTPQGNEDVWSNNQYVQNPYFAAFNYQRDDIKNRWITSFEPKFNITDWLYVKGLVGFDKYNYQNTDITPTGAGYQLGGGFTRQLLDFNESNVGFFIGGDRKLGADFALSFNVGGNAMKQSILRDNQNGSPFNIPFFYDVSNIKPANLTAIHGDYEKRINSFYGSADLSFKNYLYLTLTGRNDWFSSLTPDASYKGTFKNSIFYPSVGLSFVLSDAVRLPTFVNYAKVRASWAQVGGDTDPYQLSLFYGLAGAAANGAPLAQIGPNNVPNAKLVPLVSTTDEAGLEARLLNNRLGVDFAVYNRITTKDIVTATISPASGYLGAIFNVGKITNKGIELLLNYRVGDSKNFTWEPSINIGYNKSNVVALYGDLTQITADNARSQTAYIAQEIGKPYSELQVVAYKRNGAGQIEYDASGMPIKADKLKDVGTGVSPTTFGFGNTFRYKSLSLSFLIDAKFGGVIYSGTQALAYRYGLAKETLPGRETGVIGAGVQADEHTPNSKVVSAESYYTNLYNFGEPFVYKSDFIKLRSITLDYSIPAKKFSGTPFKAITVSLVARNIWTIKKYTPNLDPESTYNNGNAQGLEFTGMPITKTFGVNLNLKF
ncbi:MAG TPA: SusC/RagA family TonB-linked outer membrane protein [Puia sp.]|nr:SusC/RagA family TonB-linked outer membrane protein [Puia sp.]